MYIDVNINVEDDERLSLTESTATTHVEKTFEQQQIVSNMLQLKPIKRVKCNTRI